MSGLIEQPVEAVVFHQADLDLVGGLLPFSGDLRLLRASALYADTVHSFYFGLWARAAQRLDENVAHACAVEGDVEGYSGVPACVARRIAMTTHPHEISDPMDARVGTRRCAETSFLPVELAF